MLLPKGCFLLLARLPVSSQAPVVLMGHFQWGLLSLSIFKFYVLSRSSSPERNPTASCLEGINLAASALGAGWWRGRWSHHSAYRLQLNPQCSVVPSPQLCNCPKPAAPGNQCLVFCQDERGSVQIFDKSYSQPHLYHFQRILHTSSFFHCLLQHTILCLLN